MQTRSSWPQVAQREQFIAIFPDGLNRAWADLRGASERAGRVAPPGTDDVAFLMTLVAKYVAEGTADPKRIYVTGVSNGGAMTMTLACKQPQTFAAAAAVIINFTATRWRTPASQRSRFRSCLMNGTADPLVAYDGGKGTSRYGLPNVWSTAQTIAFWRKVNGCEARDAASSELPDNDPADTSTVSRIASRCPPAPGCRALSRERRRPPHARTKAPTQEPSAWSTRSSGPQNHDIDAPEVIWAVFKKFSR